MIRFTQKRYPPKPKWLGRGREKIGNRKTGKRNIFARIVEDGWVVMVEFPDDKSQKPIFYDVRDWNDWYSEQVFEPTRMPSHGPVIDSLQA